MKKKSPVIQGFDPRWKPMAASQADALQTFEKMTRQSLSSVLGPAGLRRVKHDAAIITSIRGYVVVHAPLRSRGLWSVKRIVKEQPIVGVIGTMLPLVDPVTRATLKPGLYAVGLRSIGGNDVAFDFFSEKGNPILSTQATAKSAAFGLEGPFGSDIDITLPSDDSFFPPGHAYFCISILHWKKCWLWTWPTIDWSL